MDEENYFQKIITCMKKHFKKCILNIERDVAEVFGINSKTMKLIEEELNGKIYFEDLLSTLYFLKNYPTEAVGVLNSAYSSKSDYRRNIKKTINLLFENLKHLVNINFC